MRSNMIRKRALEQVDKAPGTWETHQGTEEADLPGNKAINPVKPDVAKDASKRKKAEEQPEKFPTDKRTGQEEETSVEPSADNAAPKKRTVKLNEDTKAGETPSAWAVDNTREQWKKPKAASTPGSWAVDNTREMPKHTKPVTGDEQIEEKLKMGKLEFYEPKTAAEIDMIVASSPEWVGRRVASAPVAYDTPRFIINASHAVAVVNAAGEVFDGGDHPTSKYASVVKSAATGSLSDEDITGIVNKLLEIVKTCQDNGMAIHSDEYGPLLHMIVDYIGDMDIESMEDEPEVAKELRAKIKHLSSKVAAEGGAEEEEESEEETSVDTSVVALLDACKREWTNLGEPVNPGTWPKEIERAILSLNDDLVAAIQKVEDKLVEGEFYSKNVDEGVDSVGGSNLTGLNVAEPEVEHPVEEMEEESLSDKTSSLKLAATEDVTSTETRKALKHVQSLKDDIASKFFEFKKVVQSANDSSLVKSVGEGLVGMKVKLEDVEKTLQKQLTMLEDAEKAIEDKKKKAAFEGEPKAVREKAEEIVKAIKEKPKAEQPDSPWAVALTKARETVGEKKSNQSKIAACPTCGAKVMQNGKDTNGVMCPNCAAKTTVKPGTKPAAPAAPAQAPASPAAAQPVKQYGSKATVAGLFLAAEE